MKRLSFVLGVLLVSLLMTSVTSAQSWYWDGSTDNSWADTDNWTDGDGCSPPATIPHSATESMRVPSGTVNADMDDTMGYLMMGRSSDGSGIGNVTVNINSGKTLNVSTGSSELVSVAYTDNFTNTLSVSDGRLNVWRGNQGGELRLNHAYFPTCIGNVVLSGTGIIDTEVLNKGERNGGGTFSATGGTLVIRDEIDKFAKVSEGTGYGFHLGGATLEVAPYGTAIGQDYASQIGKIEVGNSQDTEFYMISSSTVVFDLGLSTNNTGVGGTDYDLITMWADFFIDGTLLVNILGSPDVGDYWDVWMIRSSDAATYDGSGSFDSLPVNITASWQSHGGTGDDILRLTYIPEPATVVLLGLGSLLALRRKK